MITLYSSLFKFVTKMEDANTRGRNKRRTIKQIWNSPTFRQLYSSIVALLPAISTGCMTGYSSIILPQLEGRDTIIELNAANVSWIASIAVIPVMVFPFACGYAQEKYGRKKTHYVMCLIFTVGWILIALSKNIEVLLLGRFLVGVGVGFQCPLSSVFIAETTSPETRHIYLAGVGNFMVFGILLVHLLGTFLHWKAVAWICSSLTALSVVMMMHPPDTPNWFISRGQISECSRVFIWYRGNGVDAQDELRKMVQAAQDSERESSEEGAYRKIEWIFTNFKKRNFLLPLVIMGCYFALLQISGDSLVAYYSIQIVKDVLGEKLSPYTMMLIVDNIRLLTMMFSSLILMTYCKRRTATLFSGLLAFVSLSGMAVFMYLQNNGHLPKTYFGFTTAFLIIHSFSLPLGILLLPWMLLGELFPANLKGLGTGICIFISASSLFIVTKTAPYLFESIGIPSTFAICAILVFILTVVIAMLLPETKGKTLQEIEEHFKRKEVDGRGCYEIPNNIMRDERKDEVYK